MTVFKTNFFQRKIIGTFIVCVLLFSSAYAQVLDVDRENGQDTIKKIFNGIIGADFSSDKQKNNFLEFSNTTELDYILKNNYMFILFQNSDIALNGAKTIENNGYAQLRYRDNDTRRIAPDFFAQYQWNGILGLENRSLAGVNARIRIFEGKRFDFYTSIGSFYEEEKWNPKLSSFSYLADTLTVVQRELFRLNLVEKIAFKITDKIDFTFLSYLQFPLNSNFGKARWYWDSKLFFEMSKKINFLIQYEHNYDAYRPLPIDEYYYSLNIGIQVKW